MIIPHSQKSLLSRFPASLPIMAFDKDLIQFLPQDCNLFAVRCLWFKLTFLRMQTPCQQDLANMAQHESISVAHINEINHDVCGGGHEICSKTYLFVHRSLLISCKCSGNMWWNSWLPNMVTEPLLTTSLGLSHYRQCGERPFLQINGLFVCSAISSSWYEPSC